MLTLLQLTVGKKTKHNVWLSDKSTVIRLTHGAADDSVHAHEFLIVQNKSK